MLCRVLMERLPDTVETIYLAVPSLSRDEMLAAISSDLGIDTTGANLTKMMRGLQDKLIELHAAGRQVVALIDEAHAMPLGTLEEIRLLSNLETGTQKLLQIVLFGQPELDSHLALPHMRQLKERVTHNFTLQPLPPQEIGEYLRFRLRRAGYHGPDLFGAEALRIISDASEGLTRRINIFADKTLLAAFAAGTHTITADHARAAVTDTQIVMTRRESPRRLVVAAATGLVAGIGIGYFFAQVAALPSPSPALAAMPPVAPPAAQPAAVPVAAKSVVSAPPTPPLRSLASRLAAGNDLLADATPRFAIQLMVTDARERMYIENYLAEAGRSVPYEKLFVAASGTPEALRLGVLLGPFDSRADAATALDALPAPLRQFRPFVRTTDAVRDDARRAERT
jgi:type II secretory pathway predicted ATPase ExeA